MDIPTARFQLRLTSLFDSMRMIWLLFNLLVVLTGQCKRKMLHILNYIWQHRISRFGLIISLGLFGGTSQTFSPAWSFEPAHLETLLRTRTCVDCDLQNADLRYLDLSNANLQGSNLRNANFYRSRLDKANLAQTDLDRANFGEASLRGSTLNVADLSHVNFLRADLTGASLHGATLNYTYIEETRFVRALLSGADLRRVRIVSADFTDAILCGAEMSYGEYRRDCE